MLIEILERIENKVNEDRGTEIGYIKVDGIYCHVYCMSTGKLELLYTKSVDIMKKQLTRDKASKIIDVNKIEKEIYSNFLNYIPKDVKEMTQKEKELEKSLTFKVELITFLLGNIKKVNCKS